MKIPSRIGILTAAILGVGSCALALAQMPPMGGGGGTPPGGSGTGGGSSPSGTSQHRVTVEKSGSGSGMVTATGVMINCGTSCSAQVMGGVTISFNAASDAGSAFVGWSGACSGTGGCTISVNGDVSVGAAFDAERQSGGGNGEAGDGSSYEEQYPTYASDFQNQFVQAKKPVKKKKGVFKGYTPIIGQIKPEGKAFTGSVVGSKWNIIPAAEYGQVMQGVTVGKGSRTIIRVNMTTGTVNAQFDGKDGCWMASYYGDQGVERKELYKCKGDAYQEEFIPQEGGEGVRVALIAHKGTIYGSHDGGSFFMVAKGASIDTPPATWIEGSIPSAREPLIPVEKILQLVSSAAQAAGRELSAAELYRLVGIYRGVQAGMIAIQRSFELIDFNDSNIDDYGMVEALVEKYQAAEGKLALIARQMGLASVFVRDGYWLSAGEISGEVLVAGGVHPTTAAFLSQAKQGFDFYAVGDIGGKTAVSGGTCTVSTDVEGHAVTTCTTKRIAAVEASQIAATARVYEASKAAANRAMNGVEKALFSGNGQ